MAWSTRQLAELAGTTVKAVRHYHDVGLLEVPERASNGYKQYGVAHLVRVLQIKRLVDLGVPLAQVESMGRADQDPDEAIRVLDAELAATIERLQRVRAELAVILRYRTPMDLPPVFSAVAEDLSQADRSMLLVYSRVFDDRWLDDLRQMMQDDQRTDIDGEFDRLPPDADDATRQRIAEGLAPAILRQQRKHAMLGDFTAHSSRSPAEAESTVLQALVELYNPAQLDVLHRAHVITQVGRDEIDDEQPAEKAHDNGRPTAREGRTT